MVNGHKKLSALILKYKAEDIYNMDESGLFHCLQPDKTISSGLVKGCKKAKDHISLAFCTNVDRSGKRTLTVTGKSAKLRCFKNINSALYVDCESNKKA